jgi:Fe-S-cluster-containing hydrogenase component 2
VLQGFKAKADLRGVISSPFIASLAPESCEDCGACLKRCQMGALVEVEDRVALKSDRCIGCGLCVSACPAGALTLDRRPESEQAPVPETLDEAWEALARARARGSG